jgi:hypothetical protein
MFSKWHKADLHIHTDKSKETKDNDYHGNFNADVLVEKLKDNKIELISLTDHNIINCDAYGKVSDYTDIKALVGVELDVAISEANLKEYVLALYSGGNEKIEIKPFHIVTIFKSEDYVKINTLLDKMYKTISEEQYEGKIDLNYKKKLRATTFKYLIETFHEEDFFIIAHGNKTKGIVKPHVANDSIEEAQHNILMGEISALEMKSSIKMKGIIDKYNEGFEKLLKEGFKKDPASYVAFSDNHDCNNYGPAEISTWFKGHLDYETLRICFSDPESRIHTSDKLPTYTPQYIDQINIVHRNNKSYNLYLSPYLNVIIGGRSSGKSLLFNTLLSMNTTIPTEEKTIFNEKYARLIDADITSIKTNIGTFENGVSLKAEAYCQEKIIELFKDDKDLKQKLDDFFTDFNDDEIEALESEIKQIFSSLKKAYRDYYHAQKNILKGDRSNLIKESVRTSTKIFGININELTIDFDVEYHNGILIKLNDADAKVKDIENATFKKTDLFNDEERTKFNEILKLIQKKSKKVTDSKQKTELVVDFFEKIKNINEAYIRSELDQELQRIESAKDTLDNDFDDYRTFFKSKLALRKACNEVETINIKPEDKVHIQGKYKFITKLMLKLDKAIITKDLFEEYFLNYDRSKSIYHNLLEVADPGKADKRIKQFPGVAGKAPDKVDDKINFFLSENEADKKHEIIEDGASPISTASTSQGRKASIFLDIKLDSFSGSNKTAILMIDQIEDNIDNKYISGRLVETIRKLKKDMQMILVTHNPSIAVYGDAENIIICENTENGFLYKQGGLENKEIREEACEILDGGDIAFKNRMDKYNIEKFNSLVHGDAA